MTRKFLTIAASLAAIIATPSHADEVADRYGLPNDYPVNGPHLFVCTAEHGRMEFARADAGVGPYWAGIVYLPGREGLDRNGNPFCPVSERGKIRVGSVTGPYYQPRLRRLPSRAVHNPNVAYENVYICRNGTVHTVSFAASGGSYTLDFNYENGQVEPCVATN